MESDIVYALVDEYENNKVFEETTDRNRRDELHEIIDKKREESGIHIRRSNNCCGLVHTLSLMRKEPGSDSHCFLNSTEYLSDDVKNNMVLLSPDTPGESDIVGLAEELNLPYITITSVDHRHELGTYLYESDISFIRKTLAEFPSDCSLAKVAKDYKIPTPRDNMISHDKEVFKIINDTLRKNGISKFDLLAYFRSITAELFGNPYGLSPGFLHATHIL